MPARGAKGRLGILPKMMAGPVLMGTFFVAVGFISVTALRSVDRDMFVINHELAPKSALTTNIIETLAEERLRSLVGRFSVAADKVSRRS